mgnify:CR=1 FL=1
MIFEKNSTRTRVSFETGMFQLGGHALFLSGRESQIGRGEPVEDTARVLLRYCDGIMIRTFAQEEVETLAAHANIPVINGLTDFCHPCQILADLMTIREYKGSFDGLKMCFIGDGNNMMNSLIVGCLKVGMAVSVACPEGYRPPQEILDFAGAYDCFELTDDPLTARRVPTSSSPTYGPRWGQEEERAAREKGVCRATASTAASWPPRSRTRSCSTACRRTAARRSPRKCLRRTPRRSSTRRRTACTRRRPSWSC